MRLQVQVTHCPIFLATTFLIVVAFPVSYGQASRAKRTPKHGVPLLLAPPMGWNSWDCYGPTVTEAEVKANADYLAQNLAAFGWKYVVVDIQWYEPLAQAHGYRPNAELVMDSYGRLLPAPNRFPSSADGKGFKPLADYL